MVNFETQKDSGPGTGEGRKLFYGLFIFPLLIAVGMAVLLCTVVLLTREAETPESLITAIKTGSPSKRWQKAFELSNELNQGRGMIRESGVMNEVIHILNDRKEYDARTRSFMALALSKFDDPEVVAVLRQTLREETEEDVQINLMWALGLRHDAGSRALVEGFLQSESMELRKVAVYVLGVIQAPESVPVILPLLNDGERDVRWNAALSLARIRDDSGYEELLKMLDRDTLVSFELPDSKIEEIMINAIKGLAILDKEQSYSMIEETAAHDPSLKVRQAAMEFLNQRQVETLG